MTTKTIAISDATDDQLLTFARDVLNLDVDGRNSRATIIAKIKAVHEAETISVTATHEPEPVRAAAAANDGDDIETRRRKAQEARAARELGNTANGPIRMQGEFDVPHYEVMIAKAPGAGGDAPVELWVNGRYLVIERATRVTIPGPFLTALQNAVQIEYIQSERYGDNGREIFTTEQEVPRFNVNVLRGPFYPDAKAA